MKKLAILLSLVMVLGLAVSASAAVSINGEVKMQVSNQVKEDDVVKKVEFLDNFAVPDLKLNFVAQVNDNLKATIQTNNMAKQNYWVEYKLDDVTLKGGKFRVARGGQSDSFGASYEGVGASFNFSGVKANAVLGLDSDPNSNTFAVNGSVSPVKGLTVYGDFILRTGKDKEGKDKKNSYGVAADYAVSGVTVFGEIGDKEGSDVKVVGAKTTVANINVKGKYDLAAEKIVVGTDTAYDGMTFGVDFEKAKNADAKITAYVKVGF